MDTEVIEKAIGEYCRRNGVDPADFSIKAALIDMDGTLIDSMKSHTIAWKQLADEVGLTTDRDEFYLYEGMTGRATIKQLFLRDKGFEPTDEECDEMYARKAEYFNRLPRVEVIPGARRMLGILAEHGVTRVLVTGSKQLSSLDRLDDDFPGAFPRELRITAMDVTRGKPDPQPYLRGMELAGVGPRESLVIENAPLGVESGHRAGAFVVAVTTGPIPARAMYDAGADLVFASMEEFADALPNILSNK